MQNCKKFSSEKNVCNFGINVFIFPTQDKKPTYFSAVTVAGADCLLPPKRPPPLETPNTDGRFFALGGAFFSNPKIAAH